MEELELWGGAECTINRVGNVFINQSRLTGHDERDADIDCFEQLGIKALRIPILWEDYHTASDKNHWWMRQKEKLEKLRLAHIKPIITLVHHGSGPTHLHLLHEEFAEQLACFASEVAQKFPWVRYWTPINEPLTTARFSALYGFWYPHKREEKSFLAALLNQMEAIVLCMQAIKMRNPHAALVQTEDLGKTYSTPPLNRQATHDNHRRWLTWDILCGRLHVGHPFWPRFKKAGLDARLAFFIEQPCPPDIIGINHYLTSDRFLDHRLSCYPLNLHGGNNVQRYADVEAIRVLDPAPDGLEGALREAWQRYGIAMAVTESHNGSSRDEQMRWAVEAWQTAEKLRTENIPIAAVTIWALLGNYGWDQLLRHAQGKYECGTFDVRTGALRPTAMVELLKNIRTSEKYHPVLSGKGWWQRDIRLTYPPFSRTDRSMAAPSMHSSAPIRTRRPLLITGATGTLGQAFAKACQLRDIDYILTSRQMLDLGQKSMISAALDGYNPWAVINAAAWVRADEAEYSQDACFAANFHGAYQLAEACAARGMHIVNFSSDLVFDGSSKRPYIESDMPAPLSIYGMSKYKIENALRIFGERQLTIRTAAFFSPDDRFNFAYHVLHQLKAHKIFAATHDYIVSPTYVPDLVHCVLDLLIDKEYGIWHLSNGHALSWAGFARHIANDYGLDENFVENLSGTLPEWKAQRPAYSALGSEKGQYLPPLEDAISRFNQLMRQNP